MQSMHELRKLIQKFIYSKKKEILDTYNIALSKDSISGTVKAMQDEVYYVGEWRLARKGDSWKAVYNEPISASEELEVTLEIDKSGDRYVIRDWYVKQLF